VGINHVALEVGDLEAAIDFYARVFDFGPPEREPGMAFIDMGDQFLALIERQGGPVDASRHFGLVVDDREAVRAALREAGVEPFPGPRLDFRDPWGNRFQIVEYGDIQFSKTPAVLSGMGLDHLAKRPSAIEELRAKGLVDPGASEGI
jgi:predicted enzyme related to lactoylglutathione lyase